jgi:lipid-A-disaccharide synthase
VVSAGEVSGQVLSDLFSSGLAALDPACEVVRLQESVGLEPVFGFTEGVRAWPRLGGALRRAEDSVIRLGPDAAVLISYSGLHLPLGRRLKRRGVPVLYLGPPQVWAWGGWRRRRLAGAADKMVCLFRFEEALLRRAGVDAVYCGYPLLDAVTPKLSRAQMLEKLGFRSEERYVVFLPGSRPAEVAYHWSLFVDVLARLRCLVGNVRGVMVAVERGASQDPGIGRRRAEDTDGSMGVVSQDRYDVMRHADCACAVSGTVTAELALLGVPMVVCYHLPWLSRALARSLVRVPYFALPNILSGRRLVPESIEPNCGTLASSLAPLTRDTEERRRQVDGLARVAIELGPPGGMARVCVTAHELARFRRVESAANC